MQISTRFGFVALVAIVALGLSGCPKQPQVSTASTAQDAQAATETPTPSPAMEEQVVSEPGTEPLVSEEVAEELPQDIQELNRRGYLQDVFFDTDSYDLSQEARELLSANASWLQSFPTVRVLIEGHCDERNTREYNLALGERRANAVRDYLVFLGIAADRIRTISYGEERPFALGHDESAWRLNRRAHFVITSR